MSASFLPTNTRGSFWSPLTGKEKLPLDKGDFNRYNLRQSPLHMSTWNVSLYNSCSAAFSKPTRGEKEPKQKIKPLPKHELLPRVPRSQVVLSNASKAISQSVLFAGRKLGRSSCFVSAASGRVIKSRYACISQEAEVSSGDHNIALNWFSSHWPRCQVWPSC